MAGLNYFSQRIGTSPADEHRTAAIRFLNGSVVDVAQIEGTPTYLTAMKQLAEAAAKDGRGQERTL